MDILIHSIRCAGFLPRWLCVRQLNPRLYYKSPAFEGRLLEDTRGEYKCVCHSTSNKLMFSDNRLEFISVY